MISDHYDGVYKRLYNNKYIINNKLKCLYLTNTLKDEEVYECDIKTIINIKDYVYIDWNSGVILKNNLYKIKRVNKLSKENIIKLIKFNTPIRFGLNKLSKDELIEFILNHNITLSIKKNHILNSNKLTSIQTYDFEGTIRAGYISSSLLSTVRIIQCDEHEIESGAYQNTFNGKMISIKNELSTYASLKALISSRIKLFNLEVKF